MVASFFDVLEQQVSQTPSALAIDTPECAISFAEFWERLHLFAGSLLAHGFAPQGRVGLYHQRARNTLDVLTVLFGIMRIGTYTPLEHTLPPERLFNILEDAQLDLIITERALLSQLTAHLQGHPIRVLCWEDLFALQAEFPNAQALSRPIDLAYILYTSGTSTGKPKGVCITQESLAHTAQQYPAAFGVRAGDRSTQYFSLSFDASFAELFQLVHGVTLVPVPETALTGGAELASFLERERISIAHSLPSVWMTLPTTLTQTVRLVVLGGEHCPSSLIQAFLRPVLQIVNACGLTETTVCYAMGFCEDNGQAPSIGYALPGYIVSIRDAQLQPVPAGTLGQICVIGLGLAAGYTDPLLTAKRFLADPINPAVRLFLTQDEGVISEQGEISILGRMDGNRRLKVAGKLVSLDEIEALLLAHPLVKECAVEAFGPRLVAYLSLYEYGEELQQLPRFFDSFLRTKVFAYMLPRAYAVLPALPRNASEKIDRISLRGMPLQNWMYVAYGEKRQAQTPIEQQLASIVANMLNQQEEELALLATLLDDTAQDEAPLFTTLSWQDIDISLTPSDLGIASLQAPECIAEISRQCGIPVPLQEFYLPLVDIAHFVEGSTETHNA